MVEDRLTYDIRMETETIFKIIKLLQHRKILAVNHCTDTVMVCTSEGLLGYSIKEDGSIRVWDYENNYESTI